MTKHTSLKVCLLILSIINSVAAYIYGDTILMCTGIIMLTMIIISIEIIEVMEATNKSNNHD